ncbi:hypothetical protein GTA56_18840 [Roseobacter sp. HKCCD8191]|nr:hypothetical protein [Roseobacter sp. HKCCD8191]
MVISAVGLWKFAALVNPLVFPKLGVFVMRADRVSTIEADAGEGAFGHHMCIAAALRIIDNAGQFHWNP